MTQNRGPEDFATTRWTQVALAGGDDSPQRRAALVELLTRYFPAMRSHLVKRYKIEADLADDLLQEFVVKKVYQYNLFSHADQQRGRFRTLLLTALDNFVWDRLKRQKKPEAISEINEPSATPSGMDAFFDVPWARQVLAQALAAMQESCRRDNRLDVWGIFDARLLRPMLDGVEPVSYEDMAKQFNLETPTQAANRLVTAKRMFERQLREIVGQYCPDDQIDEEIADLRRILATGNSVSAVNHSSRPGSLTPSPGTPGEGRGEGLSSHENEGPSP